MTIKTWQQRFAEHPMATSDVAKLGEIDDLRREVAELRAKLAEYETCEDFECPNCGEVNPSTSCGLPNCGLIQEGTQ